MLIGLKNLLHRRAVGPGKPRCRVILLLQQFLYITVPALKPITYLVITLGTIWSFQVFDLVYTMTGGGPGTATITMVMSIYQSGFKQYKMGYASAMAFVLFLIVIVISILQKKVFSGKGGE